ncbi:MAG: lytic transglycosylase [Mucilaginibacter sp.]|nr:lytic transglycosylase [Mucilaginibacter sp.]
MKRLLMCAISLFLLQAVKADPYFIPDSSRSLSQAKDAAHDTIMVPVLNPAHVSYYQSNIYKRRLDSIQKEVPLDYNEYVQSYIDTYLASNQRDDISRVLGLTKYYFPIYEKAFHDAGIPEEIEYLSIVESQLNPYAVSRVGATGLWQFMTNTAKTYGLNMDAYVDERRDPIQSSYAAAAYLKDAYQEFGDWLLAIASYNCGKSNVIRAIEKAGGANDFWSIRQYLPVETRGYVPAYIAITYVMNYYKKHNVVPQGCNISMKTDTVLVNKYISLNSVSKVLSIDLSQLTILNPSYKRLIVNGTATSPKRMVIPQAAKEKYGALYDALNADMTYNAIHESNALYAEEHPAGRETDSHHKGRSHSNKNTERDYITYKVHRGDTLKVIANKFDGTSVAEIKELNGLKDSHLQPGMTLKINKG